MPKLKTHKAARKRFRITGKKRLMRRTAGQNHFNSRETGNQRTKKRRDQEISKTLRIPLQKSVPYR